MALDGRSARSSDRLGFSPAEASPSARSVGEIASVVPQYAQQIAFFLPGPASLNPLRKAQTFPYSRREDGFHVLKRGTAQIDIFGM
jgi:hypothetical protein